LTDRQRNKWAETVDWSAQYTCRDCGKQGQGYYVQPQPNGGPLCSDCIAKINRAIDAKHKAELDAMPRCQVPGCTRRGTLRVGTYNRVLMCGAHFNKAQKKLRANTAGMPWLPCDCSGPEAITLAQ